MIRWSIEWISRSMKSSKEVEPSVRSSPCASRPSVAPLYERRCRRSQTGATAAAGFYGSKEFPGRYPRLQILTIAELLAGKKLEYPAHRVETFAKAERKTKTQQERLFR